MKILFKTPVTKPWRDVKEGFDRKLFMYLAPQWHSFEMERFDGLKKGDEVHIRINFFMTRPKWVSLIIHEGEDSGGWSFIDEGKVLPWPLTYWKHQHRVDRVSDASCEIVDDIEFHAVTPLLEKLMQPILWSTFAIRPKLYKDYFEGKN